jgi:hypothetical protein
VISSDVFSKTGSSWNVSDSPEFVGLGLDWDWTWTACEFSSDLGN